MAIQRSECYLLRKHPFRETSWMITVLARDFGKIKGIAKGARKLKSHWPPVFEILTQSEMLFYEKTRSNLHLITSASIINTHRKLRSQLVTLSYGSYFAELLDVLLEESVPQPEIYELLNAALLLLESGRIGYDVLVHGFEFKLMESLGFLPHLSNCIECGARAMKKRYFSAKQGGIICDRCHEHRAGGLIVSQGSVEAIDFFQKTKLNDVGKLNLNEQEKRELEQISKRFIEHRIDKKLKTLHFLSEIQKKDQIIINRKSLIINKI